MRRAAAALVGCMVVLSCQAEDGAGTTDAAPSPRPNYYEDVYPLFAANCLKCHVAGGVSRKAELDSYRGAASALYDLDHVITYREMPPWGIDTSGQCGTWAAPRSLSTADEQTILTWVRSGGPPGDPARLRLPPPAEPPPSLSPSARRISLLEGYQPTLGAGARRCVVVDPELSVDQLLTGMAYEVSTRFGVRQVSLHALDTAEAERRAKELEDQDPLPGYACSVGVGVDGARFVIGTASVPPVVRLPGETGVKLSAGHKLVAQVDYNLVAGLAAPGALTLQVEIGEPAREGSWTVMRAPTLAIPPQSPDAAVQTRTVLSSDLEVLAVYPQMRFLGRSMFLTADRPGGGGRSCLLNQQQWDLHTLREIRSYAQPVPMAAGSLLTLTCHYNTLNRTAVVHEGDGVDDEECGVLLYAAH